MYETQVKSVIEVLHEGVVWNPHRILSVVVSTFHPPRPYCIALEFFVINPIMSDMVILCRLGL